MEIYQVYCDDVTQNIKLHLGNLETNHATTMRGLIATYNALKRSIESSDCHRFDVEQQLHELENAIHCTSNNYRESISAMSDKCILDALEGSFEIEDCQEISQIKWHCRETLIEHLKNIPELQPTDSALRAMDDFLLNDDDPNIVLDFPDSDVLDLLSQLNLDDNDASETDSENSTGPVLESD